MLSDPKTRRPSALAPGDFFGMALGFAFCLALSYLLSRGRIFWEDEMLGWMLLTDPSWAHMVAAWRAGADGGGFAFYATGRAWLHLFGPSEIAFRMYSATCFGLAFVVNWLTLRRFYGCWIVGLALFNTYFCSPGIVLHLVEGRFYGLLMLSVSVCLWLAMRLSEAEETPSPKLYRALCPALFLANAVLTTSHLLGVVYSAFILAALIVSDRLRIRWRLVAYASVALSWLLLLFERQAIHASAQVGRPWFWTVQPNALRLFAPLTSFSGEESLVLALLLVLTLLTLVPLKGRRREFLVQAYRQRRTVYLFSVSLFLVSVAFLVEGFFGPAIFVNRYLIPVSVATAMLIAELLTLIDRPALHKRRSRLALGVALAATILIWDFRHLPGLLILSPDYTPALTALLPKDQPVLVEDAWAFTELIGRQHDSGVRYLYPLDWDEAASGLAPRVEVTQFHLMQNWRSAGYFAGSIVDLKPFLDQHRTFLVLDKQFVPPLTVEPSIGNPLLLRFSRTRGYTVSRYATLDLGGITLTAWRVAHDPQSSPYPAPHGWLQP